MILPGVPCAGGVGAPARTEPHKEVVPPEDATAGVLV
jgi:hypothetical protein